MEDDEHYEPLRPSPNPEFEAALGRLLIMWGMLEHHLAESFSGLLGIDVRMALCLSANMQFQSRINALRSILSEIRERGQITAEEYEWADSCMVEIVDLGTNARNVLVHAPSIYIEDENIWVWADTRAKKGLKIKTIKQDTKDLIELIELVEDARNRWFINYALIAEKLGHLGIEDSDPAA